MRFYNLTFLNKIKEKYGAFYARAGEIAILGGSSYIITSLISGTIFDLHGLIVAILTPILAATNKYLRDAQKDNERVQSIYQDEPKQE